MESNLYSYKEVSEFIKKSAKKVLNTNSVPYNIGTLKQADRAFELLTKTSYRLIDDVNNNYIKIAKFSQCGLKTSDYFLHNSRMACGGYDKISPIEMWKRIMIGEEDIIQKVSKCAYRLSKEKIGIVK